MVHQKKSGSPKKRTKGPRLAARLPRDAQALYQRALAIWEAIKADPTHFPSSYPPGPEVEADIKGLGDALKAAEGGDPVAIAALRVADDKVRQTMELLCKYVQTVVRAGPVEDAPAIISSVLLFESNVGKRSPKPQLELRRDATSGIVQLVALAVPFATVYYWEYSLDQTWILGSQTAQAHGSIAGLTPGKMYSFRFRAFKRDGTTEVSQVVTFMVT